VNEMGATPLLINDFLVQANSILAHECEVVLRQYRIQYTIVGF